MKTICLLLVFLIPGSVLAEGVLTAPANPPVTGLYDYRNRLELQDDFIAGAIGSLAWASSGTITQSASIASRPGLTNLNTGGSSGTMARVTMNSATVFDMATPTTMVWVARLNTNDANTTTRLGMEASGAGDPATSGVYMEKLAADTNWFCVTRNASTQTRTDSGIAVSTSFIKFNYDINSSRVIFSINGTPVCTNTTNLTAVLQTPKAMIINTTAAAKNIDLDYFEVRVSGISR